MGSHHFAMFARAPGFVGRRSATLVQSRTFAATVAPAAASKSSEPDLSAVTSFRGKVGKATKALYSAATSVGQTDELRSELNEIHDVFKSSRRFRQNIHIIPVDQFPTGDLTKLFIAHLKRSKRLNDLPLICEAYEQAMRDLNNENHVTLTVAQNLDDSQRQNLVKQMEEPGKKLILDIKVDESIRGGFILSSQQKEVDLSHKSLMAKLHEEFQIQVRDKVESELSDVRRAVDKDILGGSDSNAKFLAQVDEAVEKFNSRLGY